MAEEINENEEFFKELNVLDESGKMILNQILQKTVKILEDEIGISKKTVDVINFQTKLEKDCGLDSVSMMELALSIEHEYAIEISEEDLAALKTVGDVVKQIYEKVGKDDLN